MGFQWQVYRVSVSCPDKKHWGPWTWLCPSLKPSHLLLLLLLLSCFSPTLCDPIDGSPLGSAIPGILQARTLEWVAISFSSAWKWKVKVKSLRRVRLLATPWTAAHQAPPSMGFSRQEYWNGVPLPSPPVIWLPHKTQAPSEDGRSDFAVGWCWSDTEIMEEKKENGREIQCQNLGESWLIGFREFSPRLFVLTTQFDFFFFLIFPFMPLFRQGKEIRASRQLFVLFPW